VNFVTIPELAKMFHRFEVHAKSLRHIIVGQKYFIL